MSRKEDEEVKQSGMDMTYPFQGVGEPSLQMPYPWASLKKEK